MRVRDRMTRDVLTLEATQTLREAIDLQHRHKIRHIPVLTGGSLAGIVTDRDLKRATPSLLSGVDQDEFDALLDNTSVDQVMTRNPYTISRDAPLEEAARTMIGHRVGALPVVEGKQLLGIIANVDLLEVLCELLGE